MVHGHRHQWLICCGMIRSGSTLQYQVTSEIIETSGDGTRSGYVENIDLKDWPFREDLKFQTVKIHTLKPEIKDLIFSRKALPIYIYRDLRDVAVSATRALQIDFETITKAWLPSLIQLHNEYLQYPGIFVSRYEEIVNRLPEFTHSLCNHLGLKLDQSEVDRIAALLSFTRQKEEVARIACKSEKDLMQENLVFYDSHTLLNTRHIYRGEIGGWKNCLSKDQIDLLHEVVGSWLVENNYE